MFISYILHPDAMLGSITVYNTQAEADKDGLDATSYGDPMDYDEHDPSIMVLFEAGTSFDWISNKFIRPVAVYMRGVKFECLPASGLSKVE